MKRKKGKVTKLALEPETSRSPPSKLVTREIGATKRQTQAKVEPSGRRATAWDRERTGRGHLLVTPADLSMRKAGGRPGDEAAEGDSGRQHPSETRGACNTAERHGCKGL